MRVLIFLLAGLLLFPPSVLTAAEDINAKKYFPGSVVPNAERRRLARQILGDKWLLDPEYEIYLNRIARELSPKDDYLAIVAKEKAVNAFAHYGGIIVLYGGLWLMSEKEDGFIGVLAHEMGHIKLDHFDKQSNKISNTSLVALPLVIGGLLVGDAETREAIIIGGSGILTGEIYAYSRELEHEADTFGLQLMLDKNRDALAMVEIFSKLGSGGNEYISTHPAPARRGAYLAARLSDYQSPSPSAAIDFYLLREKLAVNIAVTSAKRYETARRDRIKNGNASESLVAHYGLLLLATQKRNKKLGEEMASLLKMHTHPYIIRAVAENMAQRGKSAAAIALLAEARQQHPEQAALALTQLALLQQKKRYKEMLEVYEKMPKALKARPDILHKAGRAAGFLNKRVLSNYLLAHGHAQEGNFEQALKQISIAEKFKDGNVKLLVQLSRLKKTLQEEMRRIKEKRVHG